jgi:hypothetical protein
VTGRLLIACYVGAKHAGELAVQQEAQRVIQAASLLLHMMVVSMPIALGAAEVLDETCRGESMPRPLLTPSMWLAHYETSMVHDRGCHGRQKRMVSVAEQDGQVGFCGGRAARTTALCIGGREPERNE